MNSSVQLGTTASNNACRSPAPPPLTNNTPSDCICGAAAAGSGLQQRAPKMSVQHNRRHRLIQFYRDCRGVAALEFALIALPFLILAFGILEVGCIFWGNYELDNLTKSAARLIRTGEAQSGKLTQDQVVTQVCGKAVLLTNCATKLKVSVQTFANFASVTGPRPRTTKATFRRPFPISRAVPRKSFWSPVFTNGPWSVRVRSRC